MSLCHWSFENHFAQEQMYGLEKFEEFAQGTFIRHALVLFHALALHIYGKRSVLRKYPFYYIFFRGIRKYMG